MPGKKEEYGKREVSNCREHYPGRAHIDAIADIAQPLQVATGINPEIVA